MAMKWDIDLLNESQLATFRKIESNGLYPEIVQEFSDGSFRLRYGSPDSRGVVYATVMPNGELIDTKVH